MLSLQVADLNYKKKKKRWLNYKLMSNRENKEMTNFTNMNRQQGTRAEGGWGFMNEITVGLTSLRGRGTDCHSPGIVARHCWCLYAGTGRRGGITWWMNSCRPARAPWVWRSSSCLRWPAHRAAPWVCGLSGLCGHAPWVTRSRLTSRCARSSQI